MKKQFPPYAFICSIRYILYPKVGYVCSEHSFLRPEFTYVCFQRKYTEKIKAEQVFLLIPPYFSSLCGCFPSDLFSLFDDAVGRRRYVFVYRYGADAVRHDTSRCRVLDVGDGSANVGV